jgi:hypothetical protein
MIRLTTYQLGGNFAITGHQARGEAFWKCRVHRGPSVVKEHELQLERPAHIDAGGARFEKPFGLRGGRYRREREHGKEAVKPVHRSIGLREIFFGKLHREEAPDRALAHVVRARPAALPGDTSWPMSGVCQVSRSVDVAQHARIAAFDEVQLIAV